MTLIGIEEHWALDRVDRALRALPPGRVDDSLVLNEHGDAGPRLHDLGALRTGVMDQQGVDVHILSLAPPGAQVASPAEAVALSREANDVAADAVRANPHRFRAMATLPLADPTAAAGELERAAALGLTGVMVYGRVGDVPLDDPRFDDVWAVAERLRQPVFLHPQIPPDAVRRAAYDGLGDPVDLALATFGWGWHLEAGTAALRLMAAGTLDRYPHLRLVLGHWGELLLFWHRRADSVARVAGLDRSITEYLRQNVWITASGMLDPALLDHALSVTTPDRLLFSTDYPFQAPTRQDIDRFLRAFPDDASRDAFTSTNARRLYLEDARVGASE
ncbi:amidohydrolase family protein [Actinokineospora bangkokensis]|uniref:Amidohydrolase n=1 Tax=Actinokineospora bangkokensis TaxID=1193682 RepID=A0A1Q9LQU6_9PSEU|nr:amidohydrolase family protein [Actinokineospora bangkokensis]OLR94390.1 amidohydrolase [Actinokineospora bangkokensis]